MTTSSDLVIFFYTYPYGPNGHVNEIYNIYIILLIGPIWIQGNLLIINNIRWVHRRPMGFIIYI